MSQRNSEIRSFAGGKDLPEDYLMDPQSNGVWMIFPLETAINIGSYSFHLSFRVVESVEGNIYTLESPLYVCLKTMVHQGYDPQLARQRKAQILGWHLDSSPACFWDVCCWYCDSLGTSYNIHFDIQCL